MCLSFFLLIALASTVILNSVWSSIGLKPTKPPDYTTSDESCSSRSPPMVETTNNLNRISGGGKRMTTSSPTTINFSHHHSNYLTTAMLLGTQGCGYLDQRLSALDTEHSSNNHNQRTGSNPSSLFTIDSILAPKPNNLTNVNIGMRIKSESPGNNSPTSPSTSPIRPTRVPAMLQHPGLHLSHLAAAAASSFGTTSDFLGEKFF